MVRTKFKSTTTHVEDIADSSRDAGSIPAASTDAGVTTRLKPNGLVSTNWRAFLFCPLYRGCFILGDHSGAIVRETSQPAFGTSCLTEVCQSKNHSIIPETRYNVPSQLNIPTHRFNKRKRRKMTESKVVTTPPKNQRGNVEDANR